MSMTATVGTTTSYVLTMAAKPATQSGTHTDSGTSSAADKQASDVTTGAGSSSNAIGAAGASAPLSKNERLQQMIDFIEDPSSVTYQRMKINPRNVRPMTPAELAKTQADLKAQQEFQAKYPATAPDPNAPLHVHDLSTYPAGVLPGYYEMIRSIVLNRQAAGHSTTVIDGSGQAIDGATYLETVKQTVLASLRSQISVDKSA